MFPDSEYWPYGIKPNRTTLDAFLQYCDEQGVTSRRLSVEEIFAPEVQTSARE
jgi:4,5-dihydroxyphthalate decarboxylase